MPDPFFARRPSKDGYACVKQIIPGHFKASGTAAKQPRKQLREADINLVEGILEALPRLFVDLADGRL